MLDEGRVLHMYGVGKYMYEHAPEFKLDRESMFLMGYLHDIGRLRCDENHEMEGYDMLSINGFPKMSPIAFHGTTPSKYVKFNLLSAFDIPKELILLWDADMHVTGDGAFVTYEERLDGIKAKYGENSNAYVNCVETVEWLQKHIDKYKVGGMFAD